MNELKELKELKESIWLEFIESFPQYEDMTPDFDSIFMEEEEIQDWRLQHQHNLTSIWNFEQWNTVENAKEVLKKAGFYVDTLVHIDYAKKAYSNVDGSELSDEMAYDLLDCTLDEVESMEMVWETMRNSAEHLVLIPKYN